MAALNEDTLVQTTTADYLFNHLGWDESINAQYEKYGAEGTLGRLTDREVVLTRYLGQKLMELNPGLPMEAYQDAQRLLIEESESTLLLINREKDSLHKQGVDVSYLDAKGERVKKRLRLFDFNNPENNSVVFYPGFPGFSPAFVF